MNSKKFLIAAGIMWALGLLFLYWQQTQNGRYYMDNTATYILDTRSGATYEVRGGAVKAPKPASLPVK